MTKENAMTTAHVEKFAELVGKDPALLAKLGLDKVHADAAAASASAAAFITNAVKEAKALGLEFNEEELKSFMAAERTAAGSGELSDTQLEGVSGGTNHPINTSINAIWLIPGGAGRFPGLFSCSSNAGTSPT